MDKKKGGFKMEENKQSNTLEQKQNGISRRTFNIINHYDIFKGGLNGA